RYRFFGVPIRPRCYAPSRIPVVAPSLTRREREVAILVAQGLTNREIATRLFISERTAESHVEQIRGKLGFRSRVQIANWVAAGSEPPARGRPLPGLPGRLTARTRVVMVGLIGATLLAGLALAYSRLSAPTAAKTRVETVAGTGARAFSGDGRRAARRRAPVQPSPRPRHRLRRQPLHRRQWHRRGPAPRARWRNPHGGGDRGSRVPG